MSRNDLAPKIPRIHLDGGEKESASDEQLNQTGRNVRRPSLFSLEVKALCTSLPDLQRKSSLGDRSLFDDSLVGTTTDKLVKETENIVGAYCSPKVTRRLYSLGASMRQQQCTWYRPTEFGSWPRNFDPSSKSDVREFKQRLQTEVRNAAQEPADIDYLKVVFERRPSRESGSLSRSLQLELSKSCSSLIKEDAGEVESPVSQRSQRSRKPSLLSSCGEDISKSCSFLALMDDEDDESKPNALRDVRCPSQLSLKSPSNSPLGSRISLLNNDSLVPPTTTEYNGTTITRNFEVKSDKSSWNYVNSWLNESSCH